MSSRIPPRPDRIKAYSAICDFVTSLLDSWENHTLEFSDFVVYYRYEVPDVNRIYKPHSFWKPEKIVNEALDNWDSLIEDIGESCMGNAPANEITIERLRTARAHVATLREIEVETRDRFD
jgi:hypothetical protein